MIYEIIITYCEGNEKYDLFINGELWGKYYNIQEAVNSLHKRLEYLKEKYKE